MIPYFLVSRTSITIILTNLIQASSIAAYQFIGDLFQTDPRLDKKRIEADKGGLLKESCLWIRSDPAFIEWSKGDTSNFLWLHGDAGKGKTMMAIALISDVSNRLQCCPESGILSYFFCQSKFPDRNNAVGILKGLIYRLLDQDTSLKSTFQQWQIKKQSFEGPNALYQLFEILKRLIQTSMRPQVYFIIDALDECDDGLLQLLVLVFNSRSSIPNVKWLMTSRNLVHIKEVLLSESCLSVDLERNSALVLEAVRTFIKFKVSALTKKKEYLPETRRLIMNTLFEKAEGTFLWVALVCTNLEKVTALRAPEILAEIPAGLGELYDRMLKDLRASESESPERCERILCTMLLAFRPLHLRELQTLIDVAETEEKDLKSFQTLVEACGSFFTIRDNVVYFVHKSANDYFTDGKGLEIFPPNISSPHTLLARHCINVMNRSLERNMCDIAHPGVNVSALSKQIIEGKLMRVQYACQYAFRHISKNHDLNGDSVDLNDGGCLDSFLRTKFLYWLEALSWIGKVSEGILYLLTLLPLISVSF